jgi:ABC-type antimicrobial peptide transport system permease subunit
VTPGYFRTLGIPIAHGRGFAATDTAQAPPVAIISSAGARRLWGSTADAPGRRIRTGARTTVEIVGVAADARHRDLTTDITSSTAEPDIYFPFAQRTDRDIEIAVRPSGSGAITAGLLQQVVSTLDPGLPVYAVRTLDDAVGQQTAPARFFSGLLSIFSVAALLLAAVGLYGLISYVVGLSRRDIAVRLALGADARRVVVLIMRNGFLLVVAGVILGIPGAVVAGRTLGAQLFQTGSTDPAILPGVACILLLIAGLATALPARRASRIDPNTALRAE